MKIQRKSNDLIKEKIELFIGSIDKLAENLNGDIYNFKNVIKGCVKDIPDILNFSLNSNHLYIKRKNIAIAKESLEQCKTYLSMLNSMRMVSTKELITQVEEINRLLDHNQT